MSDSLRDGHGHRRHGHVAVLVRRLRDVRPHHRRRGAGASDDVRHRGRDVVRVVLVAGLLQQRQTRRLGSEASSATDRRSGRFGPREIKVN